MKIKKYNLSNLLDSHDDIFHRCTLIEKVSQSVDFIPTTCITISQEILLYEQEHVNRVKDHTLELEQYMRLLEEFAVNLDVLHSFDFVHGDINPSNVLYDGNRLNLIDLEPSFLQIKHGKKVIMSAASLRSLNDLKNKTVTTETDKIAFYLLGKRLTGQELKFTQKREFREQRKKGYEFLPVKESLFVQLPFIEIFNQLSQEQKQTRHL